MWLRKPNLVASHMAPRLKDQTNLKGAVTMDFPSGGLVNCLVSLQIHQREVEYFATALF